MWAFSISMGPSVCGASDLNFYCNVDASVLILHRQEDQVHPGSPGLSLFWPRLLLVICPVSDATGRTRNS